MVRNHAHVIGRQRYLRRGPCCGVIPSAVRGGSDGATARAEVRLITRGSGCGGHRCGRAGDVALGAEIAGARCVVENRKILARPRNKSAKRRNGQEPVQAGRAADGKHIELAGACAAQLHVQACNRTLQIIPGDARRSGSGRTQRKRAAGVGHVAGNRTSGQHLQRAAAKLECDASGQIATGQPCSSRALQERSVEGRRSNIDVERAGLCKGRVNIQRARSAGLGHRALIGDAEAAATHEAAELPIELDVECA